MKTLLSGRAACALLLFLSCTQTSNGGFSPADRETLKKLHGDIMSPVRQHPQSLDSTAFVNAHYADSAVVMIPDMPAVEGRAAVLALWKSLPFTFTKFAVNDLDIQGSGNLAFIRGTYDMTMKMKDGTETADKGKYVEIWKKNDKGEWKCIRDISNSDGPAKQ